MSEDADEPDDEALLQAYAAGDVGAFERLFQRHRKPLYTYLVHHTGRAGVAEDLFQEVFLRVIRGSASYRPGGSFRGWLFTIAHNAMTDERRRKGLRDTRGEARREDADPGGAWEAALAGREDPVARTHARDLRARIEAALLRLPEAQREVFLLRERGGLELQRIAEVTGANLATVKSRMRYALAGLRRVLSDELLPESSHE